MEKFQTVFLPNEKEGVSLSEKEISTIKKLQESEADCFIDRLNEVILSLIDLGLNSGDYGEAINNMKPIKDAIKVFETFKNN